MTSGVGTTDAGFIDYDKIPDAKARVITSEVFGQARPLYTLRSICRTYPTTKLQGRVYVGTLLSGNRKVPALVKAEMSAQSYTPIEFVCWKNVTHVAIPDEAEYGEMDNVLAMNTSDAARAMARMENLDIIDALEASFPSGQVQTGSDWSVAANEPSLDLQLAIQLMNTNSGGTYLPKEMLMNYNQYVTLAANPEAKKFIATATGFGEKAVADKYFGMPIHIDNDIVDSTIYLLDTAAPAMIIVDGPEKARMYEDATAFYTGYVQGKFLYTKRLTDTACVKLTGV